MNSLYSLCPQKQIDILRQVQTEALFKKRMAEIVFYQQNSSDGSCQSVTEASEIKKRAAHNAIERERRECLNTKYQQLALHLPNLHDSRPSKGTILEHTLEYVKETIQKEQAFQTEIDFLRKANNILWSQITCSDEESEDDVIIETPQDSFYTLPTKQEYYCFSQSGFIV